MTLDDNLAENTDFQRGFASGARYAADVDKKGRVALAEDGIAHDLVELAAAGFVPDEIIDQLNARVPPEARGDFVAGFRAACLAWTTMP